MWRADAARSIKQSQPRRTAAAAVNVTELAVLAGQSVQHHDLGTDHEKAGLKPLVADPDGRMNERASKLREGVMQLTLGGKVLRFGTDFGPRIPGRDEAPRTSFYQRLQRYRKRLVDTDVGPLTRVQTD